MPLRKCHQVYKNCLMQYHKIDAKANILYEQACLSTFANNYANTLS